MQNHSEIVNFLWGVADLIRDTFKRGKYQDVILPFTVLRRIDSVLAPTRVAVLDAQARYRGQLENLDPLLTRASGYAFYNTSKFSFETLLQDAPALAENLKAYINGFSPNMREVLEKFDFPTTIAKLEEAGLLYLVMERFAQADLSPEAIDNAGMGTVFEELIRRFNEALNENPGEHFTPREVIHLMVDLLLAQDADELRPAGLVRRVYDPCCGTGGMLTAASERIRQLNPAADVHLYGQEVNPETYAVARADLFIKSRGGHDAENIRFGSTLERDQHAGERFDYQLANPPYGKDWKKDQKAVEAEARRGHAGRFGAGTPRISDGQLLFLQHMLSKMQDPRSATSRIAIVLNGSPLFTGDAGSGESQIRRWILEQDWLEAIVALPEQLFYNTGIATYVWILSNRKAPERAGMVQLIDATACWAPMRKSLGDKRREIGAGHIRMITEVFAAFRAGHYHEIMGGEPRSDAPQSKLFPAAQFGYRKIRVERPQRDEAGEVLLDRKGQPLPDSALRDYENVPLGEEIEAYFEREVRPHLPDAWIDAGFCDEQDGEIGRVGYEINFNRYFYVYQPPRPLDEIEADIKALEAEILRLLKEVTE